MIPNAVAVKWGLRSLFTARPPHIHDMATRSWEICPADVQNTPPAVCLEGTMDRVTDLSPWRNWETEQKAIEGGSVEHAATRAHLVENVTIAGAYLYHGAARTQEGFGPFSLRQPSGPQHVHLRETSLVSSWAGSHFFGVFLRASLPLEMLPKTDGMAITLATKPYRHEKGYRELLCLPQPQLVATAQIDKLTLYTDFAHNASKAARYAKMRQKIRQTLGTQPVNPKGVYLKRGTTGEQRVVANEEALEALLTTFGFDIVEPAKLTAEEVSQRLLDTPLIISVEGSHLAHAIYSIADAGTFLVLQPPDRFAMAFKEFTDRAGMRFAFTVGHPAENGKFTVDLDDMKRILDLLS